jgi:HSP20 family protein
MSLVRWEPMSLRPWSRFPLWEDWDQLGDSRDTYSLYESGDNIVVEANVPGINEEDIEISIDGGVLTIHGEQRVEDEKEEKGRQYYKRMETSSFHYSTTLPRSVQSEKALAEIENGKVTVTIPKAEAEKPKRIEVKSKR